MFRRTAGKPSTMPWCCRMNEAPLNERSPSEELVPLIGIELQSVADCPTVVVGRVSLKKRGEAVYSVPHLLEESHRPVDVALAAK